METKYYDGSKLLSLRDLDGNKPELYICVGNRTAGKTVFFNNYIYNKIKHKKIRQVGVIVRYKYELESLAEQFFDPIRFLHTEDSIVAGKINPMGYCPLLDGDNVIGYGICLNSADKIKKVSNLFNSVDAMIWDEFQSSTGDYLVDEYDKLMIVHDSVARGGGEKHRYVPIYCLSNALTLLNPLFGGTDIAARLTKGTKFLRGAGYVMEQNINHDSNEALNKSGLRRASGNKIIDNDDMLYQFDDLSNISKICGDSVYLCTIYDEGKEYGIRRLDNGIIYCNKNVDKTFKRCYTNDMQSCGLRWTLPPSVNYYRDKYRRGLVRFDSVYSRAAYLNFIKI